MKKSRRKRTPPREREKDSKTFFPSKQIVDKKSNNGFFQPKLEIDPVDSPAEKEADAVANQVVNHPKQQNTNKSSIQRKKKVSRKGEEEEPAAKRIQKMEEEEAAAKRIQKQEEEEPAAKRIQKMEEEEPAAKKIQKMEEEEPAAKRIQKMEEEEPAAKRIQKKEEEQASAKRIQKQEGQQKEEGAPNQLEQMIQQTKGQGMTLPDDILNEMESQFGADFTNVRIHTGPKAVEMTTMLHAHAFTHGYDIYFNEGRFDPKSKAGKELLAHELTHVVQQKGE